MPCVSSLIYLLIYSIYSTKKTILPLLTSKGVKHVSMTTDCNTDLTVEKTVPLLFHSSHHLTNSIIYVYVQHAIFKLVNIATYSCVPLKLIPSPFLFY